MSAAFKAITNNLISSGVDIVVLHATEKGKNIVQKKGQKLLSTSSDDELGDDADIEENNDVSKDSQAMSNDHTDVEADDVEVENEDKSDNRKEWIIGFLTSLLFLIAASIGSYFFTEKTGMFALGSLCEEMQNSILEQIHERLLGNMEPLRIYLQTGVTMFSEENLDLSSWAGLEQTIAYQHNFLDTYLDESRCCSGIFTNIAYDQVADGVDDVRVCHALEAPDCRESSTGSMETEIALANLTGDAIWAGVLHYSESYTAEFRSEHGDTGGNEHHGDFVQVLPGNIQGSPNNTLTFKYYEREHRMGSWLGDKNLVDLEAQNGECDEGRCFEDASDGHWVAPIGFVHWPIQDGYWYHEIQMHNMQKGDVRAAPKVFPWTLYPPAVLKTHLFTPIHNPDGKRIGGWVVGFKLHWLSQFLSGLRMDGNCFEDGCFCFIVERETGHLVATSDPSIKVLTNDDTTNGEAINVVKAVESTDERVSTLSQDIVNANDGSWRDVHDFKSRKQISIDTSLFDEIVAAMAVAKPFIMTSDFIRRSDEPMNSTSTDVPHGLDWIVVLSIPDAVVMSAINEKRKSNTIGLLGFSIGVDVMESFWIWAIAAIGLYYAGKHLSRRV